MALGPRLDLRQTQSLTMTPQLQQAIKLLALSNLEIEAFIGDALESNPLLEAGEVRAEAPTAADGPDEPAPEPTADELIARGQGEADAPLDIDPTALDRDRDTGDWSAQLSGAPRDEDLPDIGERADDAPTLAEHLDAQVGAVAQDARTEFVARHLIGLLDEPFAGIDPLSIGDIRHLVIDLKQRGIGVLITDPNVRETLDIVDRACIIYDGQVLFEGTPQALVADEQVRRLYLGESFAL